MEDKGEEKERSCYLLHLCFLQRVVVPLLIGCVKGKVLCLRGQCHCSPYHDNFFPECKLCMPVSTSYIKRYMSIEAKE